MPWLHKLIYGYYQTMRTAGRVVLAALPAAILYAVLQACGYTQDWILYACVAIGVICALVCVKPLST